MELKQPFKKLGALAAAGAVGIAGALALVTSAQAQGPDTTTIELKEPHQNVTVNEGDWGKDQCGENFQVPDDKPADQDGWVFILPNNSGDAFVSVTATFEDGEGATHEIEADIVTTGNSGNAKHAYVGAPAGWTLVTAVAEVEGADEGDVFNITHTCAGDAPDDETTSPGDETTSPGDETTSPGEGETSPGEASTSPAGGDTLPTTGAPLTIALVTAAALAAAGGAIFFMMRRRAAQDW